MNVTLIHQPPKIIRDTLLVAYTSIPLATGRPGAHFDIEKDFLAPLPLVPVLYDMVVGMVTEGTVYEDATAPFVMFDK